ncbi:centaurin-gamma-1A-like isoform X17 [Mya arenaria]|uniref:centaurin-gamma-1A-like isoform X17 n=1 Tax=Mya arenaria TaxID=6604 RepID=UPI0022E65413|nr:centaurin-gamma-1A-like isoform X17 [Mya arenaria]
MNQRSPIQPYLSNSLAVRQEIQRFESVHPSIYAIYDLIDAIPDPLIQQQIREHVVCIEDSFVNSQEWTLSRSVPDLKLGILGHVQSGKSALVHRYLTGSYMQEESPEGGRFKKEVIIDGQSYLLLIRDEGGIPEMQFTQWVDAVIFVFSLENEVSFQSVYQYYLKMTHFRNTAEIPLILVGTQDAISESNPRVIDDTRARKLANDLKRCSYYETCATYGLNVERVFQDACSRIVQFRYPSMPSALPNVPSTPNHSQRPFYASQSSKPYDTHSNSSQSTSSSGTLITRHEPGTIATVPPTPKDMGKEKESRDKSDKKKDKHKQKDQQQLPLDDEPKNKDKDKDKDKGQTEEKTLDGEKVGCGRVIPIKQGYLYKKSHGLNKDWKKKYVTLLDDGRLTYHPSLHDYMEDVRCKEIPLGNVTVKVPGMRPRGSRSTSSTQDPTNNGNMAMEMNNLSIGGKSKEGSVDDRTNLDDAFVIPNSLTPGIPNGDLNKLQVNNNSNIGSKIETPNVKKRHRRAKSGGIKDSGQGDDQEGYEFHIVSLFNKQWQFEACSIDERDEWVTSIEQQILASLQGNESSGKKQSTTDPAGILAIRNTRGNNLCADCATPAPEWASLNLGTLICIECSGIHRNLGTHISRVRSLGLDEWPLDLIHVMTSVGNNLANTVWEFNCKGRVKPSTATPREEKEKWIRAKYEAKEFLPPPPYIDIPLNQQLIDALVREDIRNIVLILGHAVAEDITAPYSKDDGRTALHIAAALGNVVFVQLLLWQNANVRVVDHEGRNALWYAKSSGSQECVELLVNSGCPENPTLPRRRGSAHQGGGGGGGGGKNDVLEKLQASVI